MTLRRRWHILRVLRLWHTILSTRLWWIATILLLIGRRISTIGLIILALLVWLVGWILLILLLILLLVIDIPTRASTICEHDNTHHSQEAQRNDQPPEMDGEQDNQQDGKHGQDRTATTSIIVARSIVTWTTPETGRTSKPAKGSTKCTPEHIALHTALKTMFHPTLEAALHPVFKMIIMMMVMVMMMIKSSAVVMMMESTTAATMMMWHISISPS